MTSCCWFIRIAIAAALSVTIAAPLASAAGPCDELDPCAARACRIDTEIARAKAKGNTKDVARLERARSEMGHCSDEGLKQKRKMALEQAQRRVDQRAADLQKAEASGNAAAIKKAQRKLESARKTLTDLQNAPL
jgi:hypothetical protein